MSYDRYFPWDTKSQSLIFRSFERSYRGERYLMIATFLDRSLERINRGERYLMIATFRDREVIEGKGVL